MSLNRANIFRIADLLANLRVQMSRDLLKKYLVLIKNSFLKLLSFLLLSHSVNAQDYSVLDLINNTQHIPISKDSCVSHKLFYEFDKRFKECLKKPFFIVDKKKPYYEVFFCNHNFAFGSIYEYAFKNDEDFVRPLYFILDFKNNCFIVVNNSIMAPSYYIFYIFNESFNILGRVQTDIYSKGTFDQEYNNYYISHLKNRDEILYRCNKIIQNKKLLKQRNYTVDKLNIHELSKILLLYCDLEISEVHFIAENQLIIESYLLKIFK